ncbi:MAG: hypothetical protein N3B13_08660 [Deltaproteobacteria bacterium]|nr:hypothetical protein [Deltaproteobacteria bacterium]
MKYEKKGWLKKAKNRIADITQKKVLNSVINSLTISEDTIRKYLTERNIPSEFINFIIQQIKSGRKNITEAVRDEIRKYIASIDIGGEIQRIISRMVIEIKTEIRLVPAEKSQYKSNVRSTVNLRFEDNKEEI